jgi:SAM-dependent methyltransferase
MPFPPDWIAAHRRAWQRKPALRRYYRREVFDRIVCHCRPGRTLELGTGPGFFAEHAPGLVALDLVRGPRTDVVADAHALPFADASFANLVGIDTFHHLAGPGRALAEAARVLADGGRLVLVEPWAGPLGRLVYRHLHQEECEAVPDPWRWAAPEGKDPLAGNATIPKAVLADGAHALAEHAPGLVVTRVEPFGIVSYLLTGGFRSWGVPSPLVRAAGAVEALLPRAVTRWAALRALFVVERTPRPG